MSKVNMENLVRYKGKLRRKKMVEKQLKFIEMRKTRMKKETTNPCVLEGLRIIDPKELSKTMICRECNADLPFHSIIQEKTMGFHCIWTVKCKSCSELTTVHTGKSHSSENNEYHDINTRAVLGAVHSGTGYTALEKISACLNMPSMSEKAYKRCEAKVGPAIEKIAKESCKRAAGEERRLVVENIEKLCELLPPEVIDDIFPELEVLRSSAQSNFDEALGNAINIIVSYDMGWSKRGNGRSYDSLNGYGAMIGFLSGKILDFATRNRKCKRCDMGHGTDDHECRKNFRGSAKAMEADVGAQLINRSEILKENGLKVRVVIGDEDSSTIASIRRGNPERIYKLADNNHLKKNFTKELYQLRIHFKEMRGDKVIPHLKKCFVYAIAQNKGHTSELAASFRSIPEHVFGRHENCGPWCERSLQLNNGKHRIVLKDPELYEQLSQLMIKYANNASKFSVLASSQGNESLNGIMAHKAPKSKCFSLSASGDYRFASSVASNNDGESHLLNLKEALSQSPGRYTRLYAEKTDKKKADRALRQKQRASKCRRKILRQERDALRKREEKSEGITYQTNCGLVIGNDDEYLNLPVDEESSELSPDNSLIIYFDLETSGFEYSADILQIAAKSESLMFSTYVKPMQSIDRRATAVTGLENCGGELFLHGKRVESIELHDALLAFLEFLKLHAKKVLLVAHNASFDSSRLLLAVRKNSMIKEYQEVIAGFSDTLPRLKKLFPERKGTGMFTLQKLAEDLLAVAPNRKFHDAQFDVDVLEKVSQLVIPNVELYANGKFFLTRLNECVGLEKAARGVQFLEPLKHVVSIGILKKMAMNGITYEHLREVYKEGGQEGTVKFLIRPGIDNKPCVTKCKKVLAKIVDFLAKN